MGFRGWDYEVLTASRSPRWSPLHPSYSIEPSPFPTGPSFTVDEGGVPGRQGEEPTAAAWQLQPS